MGCGSEMFELYGLAEGHIEGDASLLAPFTTPLMVLSEVRRLPPGPLGGRSYQSAGLV